MCISNSGIKTAQQFVPFGLKNWGTILTPELKAHIKQFRIEKAGLSFSRKIEKHKTRFRKLFHEDNGFCGGDSYTSSGLKATIELDIVPNERFGEAASFNLSCAFESTSGGDKPWSIIGRRWFRPALKLRFEKLLCWPDINIPMICLCCSASAPIPSMRAVATLSIDDVEDDAVKDDSVEAAFICKGPCRVNSAPTPPRQR